MRNGPCHSVDAITPQCYNMAGRSNLPVKRMRTMETAVHPVPRVNIYLDDPTLRVTLKTAAVRQQVSLSAYCLQAIRQRLVAEGYLPATEVAGPHAAAQALDRLRRQVGPIGVPVRELIAEGQRR